MQNDRIYHVCFETPKHSAEIYYMNVALLSLYSNSQALLYS